MSHLSKLLEVVFFFSVEGAVVTIDVDLAYRDDKASEWKKMAHAVEQRKLHCKLPKVNYCTVLLGRTE